MSEPPTDTVAQLVVRTGVCYADVLSLNPRSVKCLSCSVVLFFLC